MSEKTKQKIYEAHVDFRGSGYVQIYVQPGETKDDLMELSNEDLAERIIDLADLLDWIDDSDIEVDDIREVEG